MLGNIFSGQAPSPHLPEFKLKALTVSEPDRAIAQPEVQALLFSLL